jgi:hypothetical protein
LIVGGSCDPAAAPTPYEPRDGGAPGSIDDLEEIPTIAPTTPAEGETPGPGESPSATASGPDDDDGGGDLPRPAIDVLPSGNNPTNIDDIETCAAAEVGEVFRVDLVIEDVEELLSWEILLTYDPEILLVTDHDVRVFQAANEDSRVIDTSAERPDSSGMYVLGAVDAAEPLSPDSGDGVLARLTLEATGEGTSPLYLRDVDLDGDGEADQGIFLRNADGDVIGDGDGDALFDGEAGSGEIRVGGECPDDPDARVQLVSEVVEGTDDDGGNTALVVAVVAGVVAGLAVAAGAVYAIRRRPPN